MKKLLIIGASFLQVPGIKRAKELGFEVAVADYDKNAVGIPYADKFYNVSTIDIEGVTAAAEDFGADGIMTLATDMPMRCVAVACKKLGFPAISLETAIKATDKGEMIKAFKEAGVPSPWFFIVESREKLEEIKDKIEYPCIIKPLDNAGSRGVVLVNEKEKLVESFEYSIGNSRGAGAIIEEYLIGNEVSVEIMAVDGEINVLMITDKLTTGEPYFVEMGHSQPSRLPENVQNQIKEVAKGAVAAVGIKNGPAHVEIKATSSGPKMIELGARLGGGCITTHLVPLSTGIDMVEGNIRCSFGEAPDVTPKFNKGSAIRHFNVKDGIIKSISGVEEAQKVEGVIEIDFVKKIGDRVVSDPKNSSDRVGYVIAQADNAENAVKICEKVMEIVKIEVE